MKLGKDTISMTNFLMSGRAQPEPQVGMGATVCLWSDRHAGTIIKVTPSQVHVQLDNATRTDNNGMSESQSYSYEPDPQGETHLFRKTKNGWKDKDGAGLRIGERCEYHDYSF